MVISILFRQPILLRWHQPFYITGELNDLEGYNYARDLAIAAMRNFSYLRQSPTTSNSSIVNVGDTSGIVQGMIVADYDPLNLLMVPMLVFPSQFTCYS